MVFKFFKKRNNKFYTLTLGILLIFLFSSLKTTERIFVRAFDLEPEKYEFKYLEDEKIIEGDTFVIGNTRDYLFIKNKYDNSNTIYELKDIKDLNIKRK